ncbi:MAG: polysaccharide deacetylase family protein [Syntrophales bacterium]
MILISKEQKILGLKIDVDTYLGMKKGVPRLLSTLRKPQIKATFYLSMGPDSSGRAVFQLLKNPLFFKKMLRTGAARLYGLRTALYGTLLSSPMIALSFPETVKQILAEGHEVELHAWDHRRWQDELSFHSKEWIEDWFHKGMDAYRRITGKDPLSFGAPAWMIDDRALEIIRKYSFRYLSCSRAKKPFIEEITGVMEIPSDLPCFEEIGGEHGVDILLSCLKAKGIHVLPVHAEVEGGIWNKYFMDLLEGVIAAGCEIVPLSRVGALLEAESLPRRKYRFDLLPGRSAKCAV